MYLRRWFVNCKKLSLLYNYHANFPIFGNVYPRNIDLWAFGISVLEINEDFTLDGGYSVDFTYCYCTWTLYF